MTVCSMKDLLSGSFAGEWGSESGEVLTPVLRTANFNDDGSLDYDSPAYRCIPEKKVQAKRMLRGDIILEKSGGTPNRPVGIMAYYDSDDEALCSNFNHILRFDADSVNPFFMFHQLRWLREKGAFSPYTRKTTGLQNLQMKAFVDLELKVPTKAKQDGVAATIRAIDLRRNELKKLLEKLDELVKSRFVEMFGDQKTNSSELPTVKLGDTAFVGSSKRVFKDELVEEGIPFYRGTEVGALAFGNSINPELFITQQHYEELVGHTGKPEIGDLLMPSICPDGQIWLVDTDAPFYFKDGRVLWVRPDRSVFDSTYLQYAMRNRFIADFESFASGTTFAELKIFILKNLVVALPPLALQQEFAAFVQQVDKLKFETQQAIEKLQLLYDSLAQEYFGS